VDYLPHAEFSHNTRTHSATGKSPFELLHGYQPRFFPSFTSSSNVPNVDERLEKLQRVQEELQASLTTAAEVMKTQHGNHNIPWPTYRKGDHVLLDRKNLKTTRPKAKLSNRRYGPFEIIDTIGTVNYKLKLPKSWKIHPVFHASLLSPYVETEEHGPNYTGTALELLDKDEEYDVEQILRLPPNAKPKRYPIPYQMARLP
jgi:hypothetical protein